MSKIEEIDNVVEEISNADTLYEFAKCVYEDRQRIADLEEKLAESEKSKESYRLQNDEHHLQLCQFYSRLGVEAFGADIHEKALETLMIMKEQLAEKEEYIEMLIEEKGGYIDLISAYADKCKKHNQDKTTFAIEKLEQVKEFCNQREKDFTYLRDEIKAISHNKWVDYIEELRFIKSHIDNQIKEIKGE